MHQQRHGRRQIEIGRVCQFSKVFNLDFGPKLTARQHQIRSRSQMSWKSSIVFETNLACMELHPQFPLPFSNHMASRCFCQGTVLHHATIYATICYLCLPCPSTISSLLFLLNTCPSWCSYAEAANMAIGFAWYMSGGCGGGREFWSKMVQCRII